MPPFSFSVSSRTHLVFHTSTPPLSTSKIRNPTPIYHKTKKTAHRPKKIYLKTGRGGGISCDSVCNNYAPTPRTSEDVGWLTLGRDEDRHRLCDRLHPDQREQQKRGTCACSVYGHGAQVGARGHLQQRVGWGGGGGGAAGRDGTQHSRRAPACGSTHKHLPSLD